MSILILYAFLYILLQVSHTLLSLIDPETSQPFHDIQRRMVVFTKLLQSGVPQGFIWDRHSFQRPSHLPIDDVKSSAGSAYHYLIFSKCVRLEIITLQ